MRTIALKVTDLSYVGEWSKIWQLRIANNKCIAHRVSTIKTAASCDYAIDGYKLQWSNCTRDLGVHMDADLKFTEYISKIVHTGQWSQQSCLNFKMLSY